MSDPVVLSRAELRTLVREAVRDELRAVGMHTDDAAHLDAMRDDIRFAGKMRRAVESGAYKIGMTIIMGIVAGIAGLLAIGANTMLKG